MRVIYLAALDGGVRAIVVADESTNWQPTILSRQLRTRNKL